MEASQYFSFVQLSTDKDMDVNVNVDPNRGQMDAQPKTFKFSM